MKVVLIVLDGWGIALPGKGNCISLARTPFFDSLLQNFAHTQLKACGKAVGLPENTMGNSEVGHLHIGAGRIVLQPISFIDSQIKEKSFFENKELLKALLFAKKNNSGIHFLGLCSDGKVHSSINHLFALLDMAKQLGLKKVFVHFFADGRDVPEKSALKFVEMIEKKTKKTGVGKIASVCGRFYSMDRDNNFNRTKKAFELLVLGKGKKALNAKQAIKMAYRKGDKTDYFIKPTIIIENKKPAGLICDNDAVVFFNTRTDRIRQLIKCFVQKKFDKFQRKKTPKMHFCSFVQSDKTLSEKQCHIAFNSLEIKNNLSQIISKAGLKQLRIAETEKFAHVTYFFNSQKEKPEKNEKRILVPSKKVKSFDLAPEMSAFEITKTALKEIRKKKFDFVLVNFANADLVGHSANIPAIIKAIEVLDQCLQKICSACLENNYAVIVTADHGNAEEKLSNKEEKIPSHSTNNVPFILVHFLGKKNQLMQEGKLTDIAPTVLDLLGVKKPPEMTGQSLIKKQKQLVLKEHQKKKNLTKKKH